MITSSLLNSQGQRFGTLPSFFPFSYSKNPVTYGRIIAVVKPPVLTTFHVLNLPRFAAFCLFCDKFNNLRATFIVGKLRQIGAEYGILGGFLFMIKVLFVCHSKPNGKDA